MNETQATNLLRTLSTAGYEITVRSALLKEILDERASLIRERDEWANLYREAAK